MRARILAALLAGCLCGLAAAADVPPPQPVHATYSTALNGMPMGVVLHMDITGNDENRDLSLRAQSPMFRYVESSHFRWRNCAAEPVRYRFEFKGFGVDRQLWLDFDPEKRQATGVSRKGPVSYAYPPDASDELSLTWTARCALARGQSQVTFNVATTTGLKRYTWRVDGRESLKTPIGTLDTLRVVRVRDSDDRRRSTMWVAPSLDYLMVKMEHLEKFGVRGTVTIKSLERAAAPDAPVAAAAPSNPGAR